MQTPGADVEGLRRPVFQFLSTLVHSRQCLPVCLALEGTARACLRVVAHVKDARSTFRREKA